MLTVLKKHLLRRQLGIKQLDDDDRDDVPSFTPPASYIKLAQGKILLESRSLEHDVSSEVSCVKDRDKDSDGLSSSAKYIKLAQGKIVLDSTPTESEDNDSSATSKDKQQACLLEKRIIEVETTLQQLQERFNSRCPSPMFEKELREQLESMNRVLKAKERKQLQTCRDHKALQTRFTRQENLLHALQHENKALLLRIRQYEHCLDDVMRKVVDAIVAEDHLRLEVVMLKSRVRDLEAQNAALTASPAKGRDEGYCTMSSGQPQPSNGHLEDLPEEPEQWLLPAEPCSTEMEDWSMSQEELVLNNLDEVRDNPNHHPQQQQQQQQQHQQQQAQQPPQIPQQLQRHHQQLPHRDRHDDWVWNSQDFLNSTINETDSVTDGISQLLQQKIIYSEDEEIACTEFTDDFYKLVNIRSSSARSLYSYPEDATDDEDDDGEDDENVRCAENDNDDDDDDDDDEVEEMAAEQTRPPSPTASEAGRAQVTSCSSSSETDDTSRCALMKLKEESEEPTIELQQPQPTQPLIECKVLENGMPVEVEDVYSEPTYCVIRDNNNIMEESASGSGSSRSSNNSFSTATTTAANSSKRNVRNLPRLGNSWLKSHGWRRVPQPTSTTVGALVSPKKETKTTAKFNYAQAVQKVPPTRIPTCITFPQQHQQPHNQNLLFHQQQHHHMTKTTPPTVKPQQQQQQQTRKSKIPPPVPVRRSYSYAS